jgi:hypothetical protein
MHKEWVMGTSLHANSLFRDIRRWFQQSFRLLLAPSALCCDGLIKYGLGVLQVTQGYTVTMKLIQNAQSCLIRTLVRRVLRESI